ncbi:MAG: insulinase family protein [Bacteroidales bacterium]|nr:insulinase family protein [Bacteroidales bacterium]
MINIDRSFPPNFEVVKNIKIPEIEVEVLENGVPVYFVKTNNTEISEVIFNFDAGIWNQPNLLVASMTRSLISEGTTFHSSKEIADIFDFYGAHFNTSSGMHASSAKLMTLNKYLPQLMELVAEIFKHATFPKKEFKIAKKKNKQQLIIDLEEEDVIARNEIEKAMFGENYPYGWSATPDDYDLLNRDVLLDFFTKNYVADNLKIIVASNKKQQIIELLNKYFLDFRKGIIEPDFSHYKQQIGNKYQLFEREDALQSAVRVGWKMFERKNPDNLDMTILETLLGGYFGSRLMQNIRQKKGYTYSIYTALILYKYDGSLQIVSEVKKENKHHVVEEIKNEVLRLQNELVGDEELINLQNYMMGTLLQGLDGNFTFARTLHSFLVYDLGFDYIQRYAKRVQEMTPERLQELAKKYLNLDEMYTVIVG